MVDERSEPDATEEIENQIHSSEHPCHEDRVCLKVEPEGDSKPDQHIREFSDCGVDEDVGEEGGGFHSVFCFFFVCRHCEERSNPGY